MIARNHDDKPAGPIFAFMLTVIVLAVLVGSVDAGVFGKGVRLGFRAFFGVQG